MRILAVTIAIALLCQPWCHALQSKGAQVRGPAAVKTYLYPILKNGPYNQKRDLRKFLATAKELGCGIVLTGIFKHYLDMRNKFGFENSTTTSLFKGSSSRGVSGGGITASLVNRTDAAGGSTGANNSALSPTSPHPPCFADAQGSYMRFEEILERVSVQQWVPTATVAELRAQGWSGKLDAVVYPAASKDVLAKSAMYVNRSLSAETGVSLSADAPHIMINNAFTCDGNGMQDMRRAISKYHVVAVMQSSTVDNRGPDLKTVSLEKPQNACQVAFYQSNRLLRPALWIQRLARVYRENRVGERGGRDAAEAYLAVHVRPYPDRCVERWLPSKFDASTLVYTDCTRQHQQLHRTLGPCVAKYMRQHNLEQAHIMTHPAIWPTVKALLEKADVKNMWHMNQTELSHLVECEDASATFLTMVEEELAVRASHFLGTYWSSVTHSIVYERAGLNITDNQYLERC